MLDRLFPIASLAGGVRRHLVAQGIDVAGAAGRTGLVTGGPDLGKDLRNAFSHGLLSEIRPDLVLPGAGPQLSPRADMDAGRATATAEQAVVGRRAQLGRLPGCTGLHIL